MQDEVCIVFPCIRNYFIWGTRPIDSVVARTMVPVQSSRYLLGYRAASDLPHLSTCMTGYEMHDPLFRVTDIHVQVPGINTEVNRTRDQVTYRHYQHLFTLRSLQVKDLQISRRMCKHGSALLSWEETLRAQAATNVAIQPQHQSLNKAAEAQADKPTMSVENPAQAGHVYEASVWIAKHAFVVSHVQHCRHHLILHPAGRVAQIGIDSGDGHPAEGDHVDRYNTRAAGGDNVRGRKQHDRVQKRNVTQQEW